MAFVTSLKPEQIRQEAGSDIIIRTRGLGKHFGNEVAVRNVTLEVPRGRIFGFVGPSGSGKTTTIRMLTGYYAPTEGEIMVFDRPPSKFTRSMREKIGYMPQLFVLYPNLSVWENLYFAASIYGMSFFRGKALKDALDFVELYEHRNKLAREISGGMQRRLSLAATLVHDPDLIFLDEPTAGVDPILRQKFWEHFHQLRETGRTLFVTTQYVSEAYNCDLVGVMGNNTLLAVDTPVGLRHRAYGGDLVDLQTTDPFDYRVIQGMRRLPFVKVVQRTGDRRARITVEEGSTDVPVLLDWSREQGLSIDSIEEYVPPFDDIFVEIVKENDNAA